MLAVRVCRDFPVKRIGSPDDIPKFRTDIESRIKFEFERRKSPGHFLEFESHVPTSEDLIERFDQMFVQNLLKRFVTSHEL